ncbi:MASE1 domain-containing protein [Paraburkholderia bonniea]|uniref:MASE1 domain-containing protein n=1 Tax=Paraburkholderia bonniea TaxID=2152891 RepID=UPI0012917AD5|nr:MASE1 domain-containing protein [Paraburkholderia bonniea]WJF89561.1 MASE1 domain-containing protein [Paraburkholderia bonniea]WJF92875.1 MASE1 domain-containing protein [Paraburkholderia bonniea]
MLPTVTSLAKSRLITLLFWALLYFFSGCISHQLNGPVRGSGYIWLPAGVVVAAFMLRPVRQWPLVSVVFLVAQLALSGAEHGNLFTAFLFAIDEIGAAALAVWLVQRVRFSLEGLYFLRSVILSGALAGMLGALGGGLWYALVKDEPFWDVWWVWAASDFVGVMLVTPVLASWSRFRAHRSGDHERFDIVLGIASFALLAVLAMLIFAGDNAEQFGIGVGFALTYIPLFLTVVVTVLLGGRTGSLSVLMLAVIVILQTAQGDGVFAMLDEHRGRSLLEAQLYLAVASLLVLTVSTLKTTRERMHHRVAILQNNMELALASAGQLAYVLDPATGRIEWSGDVQQVFGQGTDAAMLASVPQVLERLHPDDRAVLRDCWSAAAVDEVCKVLPLRIVQPDGGSRRVLDRSAPLLDSNVDVAVVAGVWQVERACADTGA